MARRVEKRTMVQASATRASSGAGCKGWVAGRQDDQRCLRHTKHGQDIRYSSAEITGSYPVRTNSKSHNCCAETGKRVCCGTGLGRYRTRVSWAFNGSREVCGEAKRVAYQTPSRRSVTFRVRPS